MSHTKIKSEHQAPPLRFITSQLSDMNFLELTIPVHESQNLRLERVYRWITNWSK
jgi:hypothetical protein